MNKKIIENILTGKDFSSKIIKRKYFDDISFSVMLTYLQYECPIL